jgi:hypothetical protein
MADDDDDDDGRRRASPIPSGIGVDAHGERVIDPTKNVEDLVRAGEVTNKALRAADNRFIDAQFDAVERFHNFAREAETRFQNFARDAEAKHTMSRVDAETRRIDQLAQTRQEFQNTIRDMLAESVRTTSTLVSTQLVQIQATFDTRVSKLEAGAFTQAGKSSVADPQLADFMRAMSQNITNLANTTSEMVAKMTAQQADATAKLTLQIAALGAKEQGGDARRMGQGQVIAWIVAGFMLVAAVASSIAAFIHH